MTDSRDAGTRRQTMELPPRGFAGEGAERQLREALERVPGVVAVDVVVSAFRVRVTHDGAPGTREAIDAALHGLGIGMPHPHGEGDDSPGRG